MESEEVMMSAGEEQPSQIHALLVDHILENVMDYLPAECDELYKCRQVCHHWNFIASKVIRKRKEVTLGKFSCNTDRIRTMLQIHKQSRHFPLSRYKICQDIFQNQNEELLYDFFDSCGSSIESLVIWLDVKSTLLFYEHCFVNLELQKLKSLTFDDRRILDNSNYDLVGGNFLEALFRAAPNLSEVNLIFQREAVFNQLKSEWITSIVISIFTIYTPVNLRDLKLDLHINDSLLSCLSNLGLQLCSLNLCLRDSSFSQEAFKTLLQAQRFTLETLRLTYLYKRSKVPIEFPRMEKLSCFEVRGWDNSIMDMNFSNFTYEKHLPKLKHLSFNTWTNKPDWHQFFPPKLKNYQLQRLKLSEDLSNPKMVLNVSNIFPHLRKLEICLSLTSLSVLEIVFEKLEELEELKITKYSSYWEQSLETIDHVFTGISADDCETIGNSEAMASWKDDAVYKNLQTRPNLTNLTKLRKLEMKDLQYQAVLTDVTGYLAFLKMENLEVLDVGRSQIGEKCLQRLAKRFPHNMVDQMNMPKMSAKSLCNDNDNADRPNRCIFL